MGQPSAEPDPTRPRWLSNHTTLKWPWPCLHETRSTNKLELLRYNAVFPMRAAVPMKIRSQFYGVKSQTWNKRAQSANRTRHHQQERKTAVVQTPRCARVIHSGKQNKGQDQRLMTHGIRRASSTQATICSTGKLVFSLSLFICISSLTRDFAVWLPSTSA